MKVFFVNDTTQQPNWGCRSTTNSLRNIVARHGGEISHVEFKERMEVPERFRSKGERSLRATLLGAVKRITPESLRGPLRKSMLGGGHAADIVPLRYADYPAAADKAATSNEFRFEREAIEACDVVVVNGEGSIYDRQRKGRMILFMAYIAKKFFDKPVALVNHTAQLSDPDVRECAEAIYPTLDDVVFREPKSAEQFVGLCDFAVAADAAFLEQPQSIETIFDAPLERWISNLGDFDPRKPYVCVGGSSIYLRPDRQAYDAAPAYEKMCLALREKYGQVVLTGSCVIDEALFRSIAKRHRFPLMHSDVPVRQAVDILGNSLCYISGRWHPSIFALTGGAPIVTLTANTFKTAGLMTQMGFEQETFDAFHLHHVWPEIVRLADGWIAKGEAARRQILERVGELRKTTARHGELLTRLPQTADESLAARSY